jgi:polyketide cyclase/dehydrase/lipid transport protein
MSGEPVRVELAHRFGIGLWEGFGYITDLRNWPEYWPDLVRIEPGSSWTKPGDRTRLVLRLFGRETEMTMTLKRIEAERLVEYTSEQGRLPRVRHERHFSDDGHGGLDYRLVVEYLPRRGALGLFDRVLLRRAVGRAMAKTVSNLEARFASR